MTVRTVHTSFTVVKLVHIHSFIPSRAPSLAIDWALLSAENAVLLRIIEALLRSLTYTILARVLRLSHR